MKQAELLAQQLEGIREWTQMLLTDFDGQDWGYQPAEGMAHALWLCGHLTSAQNTLIHNRCLGNGILDEEFTRHYPIGQPVKSMSEHDYPPIQNVLERMNDVQNRTLEAIRNMSDAFLDEPAWGKNGSVHPHYRDKRGAITHCNRHEAFHAGQLATLRRMLGKPFLR